MNNNQNQAHDTHYYEQADYTRIFKEMRGHYKKVGETYPGEEEGVGAICSSLHKVSLPKQKGERCNYLFSP